MKKKIFNEMRLVSFKPLDKKNIFSFDENMSKAITLNENLKTLGYTLKPEDIVLVATNELFNLYDEVKSYTGKINAKPMYPDFPTQVIGMDEAKFRLHQLMHYFSTYGLEYLLGIEVSKGWLPDMDETEKIDEDKTLLKAKVIELVREDLFYPLVANRILSKNERMSLVEKDIIREILPLIDKSYFENCVVPFKQNLMLLVDEALKLPKEDAFIIIKHLCKHTGDVLKVLDYELTHNRYHFKTSQKRFWVNLIESYDVFDFEANIILSNKKGRRAEKVLSYLDYNNYSKSEKHKKVLASLRSNKLTSWEGKLKKLLNEGKLKEGLNFISQKPGVLLRNINWLLKLGVAEKEIEEVLIEKAESLSMQTLCSILTAFGKKTFQEKEHAEEVYNICLHALKERMKSLDIPFAGKKVFIDTSEYDLEHSEIRSNNKSNEGGYIRSGIAYKFPEDINVARFFVYWNDKDRVDIDLHATGTDIEGKRLNIGWNSDYYDSGVVFSGDITHSNAAEYIDVAVNGNAKHISFDIDLFSGKKSFKEIDKCFVGIMAVNKIGKDVKLYNPKNCFFSHELKTASRYINYGFIDLENKCLLFDGKEVKRFAYGAGEYEYSKFNLKVYLDLLFEVHNCEHVDEDNAEITLNIGKGEYSLMDENFYLDK